MSLYSSWLTSCKSLCFQVLLILLLIWRFIIIMYYIFLNVTLMFTAWCYWLFFWCYQHKAVVLLWMWWYYTDCHDYLSRVTNPLLIYIFVVNILVLVSFAYFWVFLYCISVYIVLLWRGNVSLVALRAIWMTDSIGVFDTVDCVSEFTYNVPSWTLAVLLWSVFTCYS